MIGTLGAAPFGGVFPTHTDPFPFLLEAFRPRHSIWHMPRDKAAPAVYLTFDDGPNPTATPALLDVLEREGARATFFLIDAHLTAETAPLVPRMFEEGHAVGLHSDTRALMLKSPGGLVSTLTAADASIER